MAQTDPIVVDHLILICHGCHQERTIWPDVPLIGFVLSHSAQAAAPMRCTCGATHCDVKMHIVNPEVLK